MVYSSALVSFVGLLFIAGGAWAVYILNKRRNKFGPAMSDKPVPPKVRMGSSIPVEITAISPETGAQIIVRMVAVRKWRKRTRFIIKYGTEFKMYFLNLSAMWADGKLHFNRDYEVPVDVAGNFVFEDWNELELVDSALEQFGEALGNLQKFIFTRNILTGMIIVAVIGGGFGISLAPDYLPNTVVHWLTSKPGNLP